MPEFEDLLRDPDVDNLMSTNERHRDEIRNAAKQLEGKEDAKRALLKICNSLINQQILVFFSFKAKDTEAAAAIVKRLREWSASRLKIIYQGDFRKDLVGKEWRATIKDAISKANWFIFLLPDPKDDWDWCLFETGLFEASSTSADRVICLHHSNVKIPDPIDGYMAVSTTQEDVEGFLRMIFVEENPIPGMNPLNKELAGTIPEKAKEIIEAIRSPMQLVKVIYEPWIELKIDNPGDIVDIAQLDKAIVISANRKALDLFDLLEEKLTWGEFRKNIITNVKEGDQWLVELVHVIKKIGEGNRYKPIQASLQANDGKMYRPVVCSIDREGLTGPIMKFHITFNEDVSTLDRSAMPNELSLLANLLRSSFRFRWEILEKFVKQPLDADDVNRLETALSRIEQDWETRNLGGEEDIKKLFPSEQEQRLNKMFESWRRTRNKYKTGVLDIAINEKDVETISKILQDLLQQNQDFLEMASDQFAKLIASN